MDPYRVLGIDPGSRVTGYGVVEVLGPGRYRYVECGVIQAERRAPIHERLVEIAAGLREVIEEFSPAVAAIEDVFAKKNARSALMLGQARGVALLVVAEAAVELVSYAPAFVKKTVTGRGAATKEQVQRMVTALCQLDLPPAPDASDALALALCHATAGAWRDAEAHAAAGRPMPGGVP